MKIAFFSCYLSPHQKPFSDEMYKLLETDYVFVACEPFSQERINMGWCECNEVPYVLRAYESKQQEESALKLAVNCDIMIFGSASYKFVKARKESGKIMFRYSERLLKQGLCRALKSLDYLRHIKANHMLQSSNTYLLSASNYALYDFEIIGAKFKNAYRWGYYPETIAYDIDRLFEEKKNIIPEILWAGRMIKWKHPEFALNLAKRLHDCGIPFHMTIVGNGAMEDELRDVILKNDLQKVVSMPGAMEPQKVRKYMEKANIYLFTSDYNEGWGAVLNEAMNSGCAVVCSDAVGSAGYLIEDGKDGLLFPYDKEEQLYNCVSSLLKNPEQTDKLGKAACEKIQNEWSAQNAAARFCAVAGAILRGETVQFSSGPMSNATVTKPSKIW